MLNLLYLAHEIIDYNMYIALTATMWCGYVDNDCAENSIINNYTFELNDELTQGDLYNVWNVQLSRDYVN